MLDDLALIARLRADLLAADFRTTTVQALLGVDADEARERGVFAPALRVLAARAPSALRTLVRVFSLAETVPLEEVARALPALGVAGAMRLGLVESRGESVRAAVALTPVLVSDPHEAEPCAWWILSDLGDEARGGPARTDHVMGVGGATRALIAQAPPGPVARALDLGTGCGVVALHLARRGPVVATDLSARALRFARANAALNAVTGIEFRQGDLFAPVSGEQFDLILSNPPFVISPRRDDGERYAYRDAGLVGDELAARVVREAATFLREGGTALCLANWESSWGTDGLGRVREWIEAGARELAGSGGLAAWVIERDRVSPARYAETWARDGGARTGTSTFDELMHAWLDDFASRRVVALGLGSVRLRRLRVATGEGPIVHLERVSGALGERAGVSLSRAFDAGIQAAEADDATLLGSRWVRVDEVCEEREHTPGEEAPRAIALRSDAGIARRITVDPLLAAAVGACDGELTLRQIADALASLLEVEPEATREAVLSGVRELAWLGVLEPLTSHAPVD